MAVKDNTLLMRKRDGGVKSSLSDFGMATGEMPWPASVEVKDPGTVDCSGESGERTFFPDKASLEAYDLEVEFKCRAENSRIYDYFQAFSGYLTGRDEDGTELEIYSPLHGIGRRGAWTKSVSDVEFHKDNVGEYASMTVTFRISDPETDIFLAIPESELSKDDPIGQNPSLHGYWKYNEG